MGVCAKDIMTSDVICAREDMTARQLVLLLQKEDVTGVPVLDENGVLSGVVSMTDIILHDELFGEGPVLESDYHKQIDVRGWYQAESIDLEDLGEHHVRDIMSPEAITVFPDAPIQDLAAIMHSHGIHRVIVVNEGRVVGIVSTMDILRVVMERKDL